MAFLTISEMQDRSNIPAREQTLDLSAGPAVSEPLGEFASFVRLYSDEDCFVAFGADPQVEHGNFPISCCDPAVVKGVPGWKISAMLIDPPAPPAEDA